MDPHLVELANKAGVNLFDYQQEFLEGVTSYATPLRACLYYRTGAGKSLTALSAMVLMGYDHVLVICPPSTHKQWVRLGLQLGVIVTPMSHAKFRMDSTKLSRKVPIIADEMHLFGGQKGKGWRKLDMLALHLQAPLILASATPNYNDAERVYCIAHILDPHGTKGGYLGWLYQHCDTEQNPFRMEPNVTGFKGGLSAAEFLANMTGVFYLKDDLVVKINDLTYYPPLRSELLDYGYNRRKHRMVASQIEMTHTIRYQGLVAENGELHPHVMDLVMRFATIPRSLLIYVNHATVAEALARSFDRIGQKYAVITGDTPKKLKEQIITEFCWEQHDVLIGTATLATGTDGMDRVCDTLLILDDTDDDALRRQLIGRIMPRGDFVSHAAKNVFRLVPLLT